MELQPLAVGPARGWAWIAGGFRLFARSPLQWILLLFILYAAKKTLNLIPFMPVAAALSLVAVLLVPVFVAGLMDGCKGLDEGRRLEIGHLAQGFRKNAGNLVTIGGISLIGNLLVLMIVVAMAGDAMAAITRLLAENRTITPQVAEQVREATASVWRAALFSAVLSLPLLMALWFAPLLVYFHDVKPLEALRLSFVACVKNALPMFVYGAVLLVALVVLLPVGLRLREYDLGLWLMLPVVIPSIYVSYKEVFAAGDNTTRPNPFLA